MFWPSQKVVLSSTHVNEESHFEIFYTCSPHLHAWLCVIIYSFHKFSIVSFVFMSVSLEFICSRQNIFYLALYLSENLCHKMNCLFCHRYFIFSLFSLKVGLICHFDHYVKKEYFKPLIMVKPTSFAVL